MSIDGLSTILRVSLERDVLLHLACVLAWPHAQTWSYGGLGSDQWLVDHTVRPSFDCDLAQCQKIFSGTALHALHAQHNMHSSIQHWDREPGHSLPKSVYCVWHGFCCIVHVMGRARDGDRTTVYNR